MWLQYDRAWGAPTEGAPHLTAHERQYERQQQQREQECACQPGKPETATGPEVEGSAGTQVRRPGHNGTRCPMMISTGNPDMIESTRNRGPTCRSNHDDTAPGCVPYLL